LYVKELTTYLYTKSGTTTEALEFENITVDGRNGGSPGTTCPGVVNSNGLLLLHFGWRKSVATGFDYAHTNVAGSRGLFDLTSVWAEFDEYELSFRSERPASDDRRIDSGHAPARRAHRCQRDLLRQDLR
jgi:hypothetical protein